MYYDVEIKGLPPGIIFNNRNSGLDKFHPANQEKAEITKRRNRTVEDEVRLRELDCLLSLHVDGDERLVIPPAAVRSMIENAARKSKEGPDVRGGLTVLETHLSYDEDKYGRTVSDLVKNTQFTVPVVVSSKAILKTRARIEGWSLKIVLDCDDELVDDIKLERWLRVGGRRIGLLDWRPDKSGNHGRFELVSITVNESYSV